MSTPDYVYVIRKRELVSIVWQGYREACAAEGVRWYDPRALWPLLVALWEIL